MKKQGKLSLTMLLAIGLSALLMIQCSDKDDKHLHVKGVLAGVEDSLIFALNGFTDGEIVMRDTTIATKKGAFDLMLPVDSVFSLEVIDGASDRKGEYAGFYTMAIPGEELIIEGDIRGHCTFGGSDFYRHYNEAAKVVTPFNLKMNKLAADYDKLLRQGKMNADLEDGYSQRGLELYQQREKAIFAFAKSHPNNEVSAALVTYLDVDSARKLINMLSPEVRNGRMKGYFEPLITAPKIPLKQ